jgi:hypothetical protein
MPRFGTGGKSLRDFLFEGFDFSKLIFYKGLEPAFV